MFVNIPQELWPDESEHVEYEEVYRATRSTDELRVDDFLPSNVEYANQKRNFRNLLQRDHYGVSLFTQRNALEETLEKYPKLNEQTKSISRGTTNIKRGISTKENVYHHVNYYLYDYINNSPKDDFEIICLR